MQRKACISCSKQWSTWPRGVPSVSRSRRLPAAASTEPVLADESGRNPIPCEEELPMLHKRVLVTAPRQYAFKLASKLLAAGARPLWVPSVALNPVPHGPARQPLDDALHALITGQHSYTHIAFTSKNGIYAVLQRAADLVQAGRICNKNDAATALEAAVQAILQSGVQLCALGADGNVLLRAGLPVHVSPAEASTLGLVRELQSLNAAQGAHVLCPVPLVASPLIEPKVVPRFLAALEEAGARAVRVEAYETSLGANPALCAMEMNALQRGHIDAIAFSSTAEAQGLKTIHGEGLLEVLQQNNVLLAAHGPYTAEGVSEVLGVPVRCISQNFKTFEGLVLALEESFREQQAQKDLLGLKL